MRKKPFREHLCLAAHGVLLVASLAAAAMSSRAEDWQSWPLLVLLLCLAVGGDLMTLTLRGQELSSSFIALMLAIALLGSAPATAIGIVVAVVVCVRRNFSASRCLQNASVYAAFLVAGGFLIRILAGDPNDPRYHHAAQSLTFALIVFAVSMAVNALNFALIAVSFWLETGRSLVGQVRTLFIPLMPSQAACSALAAIVAVAYTNLGYPALLGFIVIILMFQWLSGELLRSQERAEQLDARSKHLASLQFGVLATLVETLALRDQAARRHADAVAHYAGALAREVGSPEADQDLAHKAGLLHDLGKFALPDRVLHAATLTPQDWALIRRHPQDGATLVGRLDGFGPVADAILYHHENVDGTGYPAGLIGREIPLLSRILAVCNVFDTLTSRDSYRTPTTPEEALDELRRVAGHQLDADLVEAFVQMVQRVGPLKFIEQHGDVGTELAYESRARSMARAA